MRINQELYEIFPAAIYLLHLVFTHASVLPEPTKPRGILTDPIR